MSNIDWKGNRKYDLSCSYCSEYTRSARGLIWDVIEEKAERFCSIDCQTNWIEKLRIELID